MEEIVLQLVDVHNKIKDIKQNDILTKVDDYKLLVLQRDKLIESIQESIKKKESDIKISKDEKDKKDTYDVLNSNVYLYEYIADDPTKNIAFVKHHAYPKFVDLKRLDELKINYISFLDTCIYLDKLIILLAKSNIQYPIIFRTMPKGDCGMGSSQQNLDNALNRIRYDLFVAFDKIFLESDIIELFTKNNIPFTIDFRKNSIHRKIKDINVYLVHKKIEYLYEKIIDRNELRDVIMMIEPKTSYEDVYKYFDLSM